MREILFLNEKKKKKIEKCVEVFNTGLFIQDHARYTMYKFLSKFEIFFWFER